RLTPLAQSLPATVPFVGPEAQERARGTPFRARIGANESVFGPSPGVVRAMSDTAAEVWKYPDPENHELTAALAAHLGVAADNIVVGEGIDGLLGYTVRLFAGPGDAVVTSDGAYPTFNYHVVGHGAELHKVPYKDDHEDPEALVAKARETGAKLLYMSNPDNPMGTWHGAEVLSALMSELPAGCLLILDEAYGEFAPASTLPPLDTSNPQVLRFRTFSKAYGMAGARVGYAIGDAAVVSAFDRVRNHFGMTRMTQAGALAALNDQAWLSHVITETSAARSRIAEVAITNGLSPLPSAANFVAVDCGHDGGFARRVLSALGDAGLFVRMPFVAPQDRAIRIGCGTAADLDLLEAALPGALAHARP
ncbi:MAG: pyridoxal phosphate-dependent aminotransferase, partial [Pseudomonadota bacterium]